MGMTFDKITMVYIRKLLKKDNNHVISLLMFYENIKSMILKVLGSVIYCIMENYLCVNYLRLHQVKVYLAQ